MSDTPASDNIGSFAKSLRGEVKVSDSHLDHPIDAELVVDDAGIGLTAAIPGISMEPWQRKVLSNVFERDTETGELVVRPDLFVTPRRTGPTDEWLDEYADSLHERMQTFVDEVHTALSANSVGGSWWLLVASEQPMFESPPAPVGCQ